MVKLTVRKFGNSLGVVLPKGVILRLHTGEGGHLLLIESPDGTFQLAVPDTDFEYNMKIARPITRRCAFWRNEGAKPDWHAQCPRNP